MKINYELKPEDLYAFSKENAKNQNTHKPLVTFFAINYLLFIFADVIYAYFAGSLSDWNFRVLMIGILARTALMLIAVAVLLAIIKFISLKKVDNVVKGQENGLFCEHRVVLTENEFTELTDFNISHHSWKSVGEIKETENFISINILMSSSYIIPKNCFPDQKHLEKFIETANYYQRNAGHIFQPSYFTRYDKNLE